MGIHKKARMNAEQVHTQLQASPAGGGEHRFTCRLVTPMYGGGVKAGEVDLAMPIRATAVRGQLRHWWRLLNRKDPSGQLRTNEALFQAERNIWGGLGDADSLAASKVAVVVLARSAQTTELQPAATFSLRDGRPRGPHFGDLPGYVLFPAQGKSERGQITEPPKQLLKPGLNFTLMLRFDASLAQSERDQVFDAARWWASFGGVGARTRRGCGAIEVKDANDRLLSVSVEEVQQQGWQLVLGSTGTDAVAAWTQAANSLRDFRQKPGFARNNGQGARPGRSRWPEPDAIRRLTGKHAPPHPPEHPAGNVFPRAAFGLPIITHFKQEREWQNQDPGDTTLKPVPDGSDTPAERMASPLILRPYNAGNGWCPAVLCLDLGHIRKMGLELQGTFRNAPHRLQAGQWEAGDKADLISPMQGGTDAITAFLAYFADQTRTAQPGVATPVPPRRIRTYVRPNVSRRGPVIRVEAPGQASRDVAGDAAARIYASLSDYARQRLDTGRPFNRLDITFDGWEFVNLVEHAT